MPYVYQRNEKSPAVTVYHLNEPGCKSCSKIREGQEIQKYEEIRDNCLKEGKLFEDPYFKMEIHDEDNADAGPLKYIKWLRPKEIRSDPRFISQGTDRFDVRQKSIGNCWVLASMACITLKPEIFERVVPLDQSLTENYAGVFHFRFWHYGKWVDVVIDDRLPTVEGKLYSVHSSQQNEFWSPLLEKAYAKLYTSYDALVAGLTTEAMEDFTGGVSESFQFETHQATDVFSIMWKAYQESALLCCGTREGYGENIPGGHAYSITNVRPIKLADGKDVRLIRIRNPWGEKTEWRGRWSDESPSWDLVPEDVKKELNLSWKDDGEFWMEYDTFKKAFADVRICHLCPNSYSNEHSSRGSHRTWHVDTFEGSWIPSPECEGEVHDDERVDDVWLSRNPQFRFKVEDVDDQDCEGNCVIISLIQRNVREGTISDEHRNDKLKPLECFIYRVSEDTPYPLPSSFFVDNDPVKILPPSHSEIILRVSSRTDLPAGVYCIIPSPWSPCVSGDYLLRVFTLRNAASGEQKGCATKNLA